MKNVGVKCAVVLERGWRWTHVDFYLQTSGEMELDLSEASHHETSAALKEKKKKSKFHPVTPHRHVSGVPGGIY